MGPRVAIVVFPGSNCDRDCARAWESVTGGRASFVWHKEGSLPDLDAVILPGGFSFGDYLRSGAIARFSPVMAEVARLAKRGSLVLGICNGFQILTEAGLLPGSLIRNQGLKYMCKDVFVRVENARTPFTGRYREGQVLRIPISHGEGNYTAPEEDLRRLRGEGRVVLRYCDRDGAVGPGSAPNGSLDSIAGVASRAGNVLGIMPHPERVSDPRLGGTDGSAFWESMAASLLERGAGL
jgi:phosphoribosylformylglycinamidine synthase